MAKPVHRGRIDPVDAAVERRLNGLDRLAVVLGTPCKSPSSAPHRPSTHPERRYFHVAVAELFQFHRDYCRSLRLGFQCLTVIRRKGVAVPKLLIFSDIHNDARALEQLMN